MREKLIQYVELLFAGVPDSEEMKQEILQNTLDRYDDLIREGKVPEAAYRLAIGGIGDISELLTGSPKKEKAPAAPAAPACGKEVDEETKKRYRAIAVGLYITCAIPLFLLSELGLATLGLCFTIALVAVATVIMIVCGKKDGEEEDEIPARKGKPEPPLLKSINGLIWAIGLAVYFLVSFATDAWFVTWLIFPIIGAVQGLVRAIWDLKEANRYES